MGRPDQAAAFCRELRLPFTCIADAGRESYRAYGLRRGTAGDLFGPASLAAGARAMLRGHFVRTPVGDVYQLGGIFMVGTDGRIVHARYPRHAGDQPAAGLIAGLVDRVATP